MEYCMNSSYMLGKYIAFFLFKKQSALYNYKL